MSVTRLVSLLETSDKLVLLVNLLRKVNNFLLSQSFHHLAHEDRHDILTMCLIRFCRVKDFSQSVSGFAG